jgi:hypothetical protein
VFNGLLVDNYVIYICIIPFFQMGFFAYLTIYKRTSVINIEDLGFLNGFRRCFDDVGFVLYNTITIEIPT